MPATSRVDRRQRDEQQRRLTYGRGDGGTPGTIRRGPAEIIPFPMAARRAFLDRTAITIATCKKAKQQPYRERAEQQQRDALRRRQLPEDVIESEIAVFNKEIDWRLGAIVDA
jgi:hypothetical protein